MEIRNSLGNVYLPGGRTRLLAHKMLCIASDLRGKPDQKITYWVSHKKKFVFLVNPLVASQSTTGILLNDSKKDGYDLIKHRRLLNAGLPLEFQHYYKFAFVRNPWERAVSCFHKKIVNADTQSFTIT